MAKQTQILFFKPIQKKFGGSRLKGNPKCRRPLSTKYPLHLVLKSNQAFGSHSMLHTDHKVRIERLVFKQAKLCGIRIYHFVNVGNHLHLVMKIHDRDLYRNFIRAISGLIARQVLKRERRKAKSDENNLSSQKRNGTFRFWVARPFTRLANWGRDYNNLCRYMQKNMTQAKRFGQKVTAKLGNCVIGFDILEFSSA